MRKDKLLFLTLVQNFVVSFALSYNTIKKALTLVLFGLLDPILNECLALHPSGITTLC